MDGQHYIYNRSLLHKQEVLYRTGQVSTKALVFGSYCGHTLLILLASNPALRIVCVDDKPYAPVVVHYLNQHFQNRIMLYVGPHKVGPSSPMERQHNDALALFADNVFDLIHLDTELTLPLVVHDFNNLRRVAKQGAFLIFDGYEQIRSLVDTWIANKLLSQTMVSSCLWTTIVTNLCQK